MENCTDCMTSWNSLCLSPLQEKYHCGRLWIRNQNETNPNMRNFAANSYSEKNYICLEGLDIPRTYSIEASSDRDLLIFANAYILAIGAVAYMVTFCKSWYHQGGTGSRIPSRYILQQGCLVFHWKRNQEVSQLHQELCWQTTELIKSWQVGMRTVRADSSRWSYMVKHPFQLEVCKKASG